MVTDFYIIIYYLELIGWDLGIRILFKLSLL
jgi:hypothetical protein